MPQAELDMIQAEYDAMNRQDWEAVFLEATTDFEFRPPDRGLGSGATHGPERAREDIKTFFSPFEEVIIEAQEIHERGDRIVVFFRLRTRPHGSTAMVEIRAGHVWTLRDRKLAGLAIFPEREKALEAAEATQVEVPASD
jgi:ketosteroid isomerase-like protein